MSRLKMAGIAGLALVLAGCGTAASSGVVSAATTKIGPPVRRSLAAPSPASTPVTPASTPVTPASNVVTAADNGLTISLVTGQRLQVDLAPGAGAYAWDRPRLAGSGLRLVSVSGGYPGRSPVRAVFLATGPGTAVVSSQSDMPCLHQRPPCLIAQRIWTITLIITTVPS